MSGNHLLLLALVAAAGLTAMPMLGDAAAEAATGDVASEETVVAAAQAAHAPAPGEIDVDVSSAPGGAGSGGGGGGGGNLEFDEEEGGGGGGGFLAGVGNFVHNFGLNPFEAIRNPWEYVVVGGWNRVIGIGKFAWNTVSGLGSLLHTINELYNPAYPFYWYDLVSNGPSEFFGRRLGVLQAGAELVPGVASFGWETSVVGIGYDAIFNRDTFAEDRLAVWDDFKNNPLVQAVYEPIGGCAGETSHGAMQDCGELLGDALVAVATGGVGKGATGAGRAGTLGDDLVRLGDDGARLADDGARLGDDAARAGDDAVRTGDDVVDTARVDPRSPALIPDELAARGLNADDLVYRGQRVPESNLGFRPLSPNEVFDDGLQSGLYSQGVRPGDAADEAFTLETHVADGVTDTNYVATSRDPEIGVTYGTPNGVFPDGYVYVVEDSGRGIDVNNAIPGNPHSAEAEVAFEGVISPDNIVGAYRIDSNGDIVGGLIENPNFR